MDRCKWQMVIYYLILVCKCKFNRTVNQPGYVQQLCDLFLHDKRMNVSTPMIASETPQEGDDDPMDITA